MLFVKILCFLGLLFLVENLFVSLSHYMSWGR